MKKFRSVICVGLIVAVAVYVRPVQNVFASSSAQESVIASAEFVPAKISRLGFATAGVVKEVMVKEGDAVKAGDVLAVLDAPDLQFAVTAAEAALRSAETNAQLQRYGRVKERRNGKIFWTQLPKEYIEIADIQVRRAQAALEGTQAAFAQTILVAPFDGVVAVLDVIPGETAQPGQAIITLAALDAMQLETIDLSERDIARVGIGDPVSIFVEALNENFAGKVTAISPRADVVGGDVVFKVTVQMNEQPPGIRWGMTAEVNISE